MEDGLRDFFFPGERRKEKEIKYKRKPAYEESSNVNFLVIGVRKRMEKLRLEKF